MNAAARPVHRHLVRRPRLRLDADDQRPGHAAAERRHRDEVRRRSTLAEAIVGRLARAAPATSRRSISATTGRRAAAAAPSASASPSSAQLDIVEVTQKFYRTHPDNYDQLVIWTDASLIDDAFAFETTVANEIRGIGVEHLRRVARLRQRRPAAQLRDDGLDRQVSRRSAADVPRREQHRQRARPGSRPSLAGVPRVPRSHRRALGRAARPRSGALELLLRFGRLGDGRQRHRGSRRRLVPDRRRGAPLQPARSVRDGAGAATARCRRSSTCRTRPTSPAAGRRRRRRRSASRSTARAATC